MSPIDLRLQAGLDAPLRGTPTQSRLEMEELFPNMPKRKGKYAARGYAALPGTGPNKETCGSCRHVYAYMRNRTYYKCAVSRCQSKSAKGDVSTRSPACSCWEAKPRALTQGTGESWGA